MAYKAKTLDLAWKAMQQDMVRRITTIGYEGGAIVWGFNNWKATENPHAGVGGVWVLPGQRPNLRFEPLVFEKFDRKQISATPMGEMKREYTFLDSWYNGYDYAGEYTQQGGLAFESKIDSSESNTIGWSLSVSVESGYNSGSTGGGFFKAGLSVGTSGERSRTSMSGEGITKSAIRTLKLPLPPKNKGKVQQAVDKGKLRVHFVDRMIVDPGWSLVAFKRLGDGRQSRDGKQWFLAGNHDWGKWGKTKSRVVWKAATLTDLETMLIGQDPRYPSALGRNLLQDNPNIRENFEWLQNPENRTIEVDHFVVYDESQFGDLRLYGQEPFSEGEEEREIVS